MKKPASKEKKKLGCLIKGLKVPGIGLHIILVISILIGIFACSESESIEFKYVHTAVNLRNGPGTNHDVIVTLSPGSKVEVIEKSGEWWKVKTSEVDSGYVYQSLLWPDPPMPKPQQQLNAEQPKRKESLAKKTITQPTKKTITQPTKETSEHSLGYKLAVVETGNYYYESDLKVKRYNSLINQLSGKYVDNKQQIANITVTAKQILTENGIDENMINIMEGMNKIYDLNNSYRKYNEYSSCYVIFRINGYNHDKSLSLLQESINTFGIKGVLKKLGIK